MILVLLFSIILAAGAWYFTQSIIFTIIVFIVAFCYLLYQFDVGMAIHNNATQHKRDAEIVDAIRDLKDKE